MNKTQSIKHKYICGRYNEPGKYRGWFVGSFLEKGHPCKTKAIEILYREHKKGDADSLHYHKYKIEIVIVIKGKIKFNIDGNNIIVNEGDYIFLKKNVAVSSEFLKPTKIFVIHSPSIPKDKKIIE